MEKKYHIPQKHAQHINWNSIMPSMLNIWRRVRATETEDGDILVEVIDEEALDVARAALADAMKEITKLRAYSTPPQDNTALLNAMQTILNTTNDQSLVFPTRVYRIRFIAQGAIDATRK